MLFTKTALFLNYIWLKYNLVAHTVTFDRAGRIYGYLF